MQNPAIRWAMHGVLAASGADRVIWRGIPDGPDACPWSGRKSWGSLSRTIDWGMASRWCEQGVVRVERSRLERSPRFANRDVTELWIFGTRGRTDTAALTLLESSRPLRIEAQALRAIARGLSVLLAPHSPDAASSDQASLIHLGREAASIVHDLRHLLTLATLEIDLAARSTRPPELLREALESARQICERSLCGEPSRAHVERFALAERLRSDSEMAERISGRGEQVRIVVTCPADLHVMADPSVLSRLVQNLLLNAIRASPNRRVVRLEARRRTDGGVEIAVEDRGRGMLRAEVGRLFRSGTSASGGRGHGTTSITQCIEHLGGELHVRTRAVEGTRISVLLPSEQTAPALVLVDRDVQRRNPIARELRARGWSVRVGSDPEDAAKKLRLAGACGVAIARGTPGNGLFELMALARQMGIPVRPYGVTDGDPCACAKQIDLVPFCAPIKPAVRGP